MPDVNPNYTTTSIRQNGTYGKGLTAKGLGSVTYLGGGVGNSALGDGVNAAGVATPCAQSTSAFCNPGQYKIGDAARDGEFGDVRNPSTYNLNMSLFRTFSVVPNQDRLQLVLRLDCANVTNHVTFSGLSGVVNSTAFGQFTSATGNGGSRSFQVSGRLQF
jgi:hypothetical protein